MWKDHSIPYRTWAIKNDHFSKILENIFNTVLFYQWCVRNISKEKLKWKKNVSIGYVPFRALCRSRIHVLVCTVLDWHWKLIANLFRMLRMQFQCVLRDNSAESELAVVLGVDLGIQCNAPDQRIVLFLLLFYQQIIAKKPHPIKNRCSENFLILFWI